MGKHLFPEFLSDSGQYDEAERFWRRHWEDLIQSFGEQDMWESPWLKTTFANGTLCRDGNPIFSCVCRTRRVGIRVIQLQPAASSRELYFWTDTFGEAETERIDELVISCVLTKGTLYDALDLMRQWISDGEVSVCTEDYASVFRTCRVRRPSRELALTAD